MAVMTSLGPLFLGAALSVVPFFNGGTRDAATQGAPSTDGRLPVSALETVDTLKSVSEAVGLVQTDFPQAPLGTMLDTSETGSGVLVAPCLVLTARHVLGVDAVDNSNVRRIKVTFYKHDKRNARTEITSLAKVRANGGGRGRWSNFSVTDDWAILELETPVIGLSPISLDQINCCGPLLARRVALVGFPADHYDSVAPVAWLDPNCRITQRLANNMLMTSCLATSGNSGGAVVVQGGERWTLGGLLTRAAPPDVLGRAQFADNFALPIGSYMRREVRNALLSSSCAPERVTPPSPRPSESTGELGAVRKK